MVSIIELEMRIVIWRALVVSQMMFMAREIRVIGCQYADQTMRFVWMMRLYAVAPKQRRRAPSESMTK
jgi:hypothetical protein